MPQWMQDIGGALHEPLAWSYFRHFFVKYGIAESLQYLVIVTTVWLVLHVVFRKRLAHRLIAEWPRRGDMPREIAYAAAALAIYAAGASAMLGLVGAGRIEVYSDPLAHGVVWLLASLPLLLLWQDFFLYVAHRLLHTRWLFRHVHAVHHRSRQPSPWSAYAVHPIEAVVNGSVLLTWLMFVPLHQDVLGLYLLHQVVRNAHGHSAIESLPAGFNRHAIGRWFTTSTHHHMHHESPGGNYGLWFTWWDRFFGTEHPDYMDRFDGLTTPRATSSLHARNTSIQG